jgi:hypothetical protein
MKYTEQNQEEENQGGNQGRGRGKKNRGNQFQGGFEGGSEQEEGSTEQNELGLEGEEGSQGGGSKRKQGRKSRFNEQEGEEGEMGESGEGSERPGRRSGNGNKVENLAKKVMTFLDDQTANMDKETLAKYAAVGVLLLAGMRKSGFLGGLAVSVAAGVLTKLVVESSQNMQGEEEGEEEFEEEGETATA